MAKRPGFLTWAALLVAVAAALAGGAWVLRQRQVAPRPPDAVAATAPTAPSVALPASAATPPAPPAAMVAPPTGTPAMTPGDIAPALAALLGSKTVQALLQTDDFAHRVVATVDNLGRDQAPARLWPVVPTAGRFTVDPHGGTPVIAADNAQRYTALVLMVESVDAARAADLYRRLYPLLQQAYEDLGFPGHAFNDRLVEVIDLLLATPEAPYPVPLTFTAIKGPVVSERPWVHYEFADPALRSLAAGQKILVRTGAVNERRLKTWLRAFRHQIAATAAGPGQPH